MIEIVLATGNPHKVEEMSAIFAGLLPPNAIRLVGLRDLATMLKITEPVETGGTFEDNASIKAVEYARQTGMLCLADDSGLEIDALGGRPGVISSHYCTDGREAGMNRRERDGANNQRVIAELAGVSPENRTARFVCVMALSRGLQDRDSLLVRGTFEGRIGLPGEVPRGDHGFGYDPLFLVAPEYRFTSAELPPDRKNQLSHRAAAARLMADRLRSMLPG